MIKGLPKLLQKHLANGRSRFALLLGTALIGTGLMLGVTEDDAPPPASVEVRPLAVPPRVLAPEKNAEVVSPVARTETVSVGAGDSLDGIFRRLDIAPAELAELMDAEGADGLRSIHPGQDIALVFEPAGRLLKLRTEQADGTLLEAARSQDGFVLTAADSSYQRQVVETSGTIQHSLFLDGSRAGMSDNAIMKLARIFGWDIDFVLDIRSGDEFHVIYEKLYRNGEFIKDGDIIAATFINQGARYKAIRFETEAGGEYFAPDGRNMKKAFLRAPLDFSRVSSEFNPRRYHPVQKRVKPHNGIDYAAPTGTPVYAAGEGRVIRSAFSKFNGHHVFIQHPNNIVTRYLHFSRRAVKPGQRVRQGQVIGYVGATGLASGPHLHYEFLLNGVHRNPRTVALPKAEPLSGDQLLAFQSRSAPLLRQLDRLEGNQMLASAIAAP